MTIHFDPAQMDRALFWKQKSKTDIEVSETPELPDDMEGLFARLLDHPPGITDVGYDDEPQGVHRHLLRVGSFAPSSQSVQQPWSN